MKKNFFLWVTVFAVGAMSSCSVDKVVNQAEARYIGFDPFANKTSRGITATDFGHDDFDVWGKYDGVEVFDGKTVNWQDGSPSGSWTYQPLVPWVDGKTYEFAAIAPANAPSAAYDYNTNKYSFGPVTVDLGSGNQTDYMVADVKEGVKSNSETVQFTFNHTLSKVNFKFAPQIKTPNNWQSDIKIVVKEFTLSNVLSQGSCAFTYAAGGNTISWTDQATMVDFKDGTDYTATYEYQTPTATPSSVSPSWLVIPQTEGTRTLSITCDIYNTTGGSEVLVKEDATASVAISNAWEGNTYYTYTVYIGTDILGTNPYITFDVKEVKDWTDDTSNSVDVTPTQP